MSVNKLEGSSRDLKTMLRRQISSEAKGSNCKVISTEVAWLNVYLSHLGP